jgi:HlyD family secretion protein
MSRSIRIRLLAGAFVATVLAVGTASLWRPTVDPVVAGLGRAFGLVAEERRLLGYLEADTTMIAAPVAGRLVARPVERGDRVAPGRPLFALDVTEADAGIARLAAQLAGADARLADAHAAARRPEEQNVIRAQRDEARAQLALAERDLERQSELQSRSVSARSTYDQAVAQVAQLKARIAGFDAQLTVGDLGGRTQQLAALAADRDAVAAQLAETRHRRADMTPTAPVAGRIEETFYSPGEWVPAGVPVVSLVADGALKLRFFVAETEVATVRPGETVAFACDGCRPGLTATVERVATKAEYTPPVIYSTGARAKLVFLVEARPSAEAAGLSAGLPVEVTRTADGAAGQQAGGRAP